MIRIYTLTRVHNQSILLYTILSENASVFYKINAAVNYIRQLSTLNGQRPSKSLSKFTGKFVEKYEISKKTVKGIVKG